MSEDTTTEPEPSAAPTEGAAKDDKPLGEGGKKALDAERARADAAAKRAKELEARLSELEPLASLKPLADVLGGKQTGQAKSDLELLTERLDAQEKAVARAQLDAARAQVAAAKGLTEEQAARLVGGTRDELAADADKLLALFPTAPAAPRTPVPDPTQGARGAGPDLDAQIKAAQAAGDPMLALRLNNQKLAALLQDR